MEGCINYQPQQNLVLKKCAEFKVSHFRKQWYKLTGLPLVSKRRLHSMQSLIIRPLRLLLPIAFLLIANAFASRKYHRYFPRRYDLTLSVRNHNVSEAKFFRLNGVGHTADFYVAPGDVFTKTYEVTLSLQHLYISSGNSLNTLKL